MADVEVLELLQKIDARLDKLEEKQNEAMNALSIFGDSLDELFKPNDVNGKHNLEKVEQLKDILETLNHRDKLNSIKVLMENLNHVADLAPKLSQLDNGVSMSVDVVDEFMSYAMANGLDVEKFLTNLKQLSFLMVDAFESGAMTKLLESGVLDHRSIETVGALGKSMAVSGHQTKPASFGQIFGALFDPNVRSAIGFALNFASQFGKTLNKKNNKHSLPAGS